MNFEKAFDRVERAIKNSLQNSTIDYRYTDLITNIYKNASISIKLTKDQSTKPTKIERGVREGDTISQ